MNFPWEHSRRYNAYANHFVKIFGSRVQKISVNAGFTCPNRDGSISTGGCTFCNNEAFNPSYCDSNKPLHQQIAEGIEFHKIRYRRASNYLVYFQPFSNTYASTDRLEFLYNQALSYPNVKGIVIGTRPDCISDKTINLLKELSKNYYVVIEIGIESCHDKSLTRINRGHTNEQSLDAIRRCTNAGIKTGVHLINGLPCETREMIFENITQLNQFDIYSIKFHQLQIIKNTQMETDFKMNPNDYSFVSLDEYVELCVDIAERIKPSIIIERIAGEVPPRFLSGPNFGLVRNDEILRRFERKLEERDTYQGKIFTSAGVK